jgi:hypothetical protein
MLDTRSSTTGVSPATGLSVEQFSDIQAPYTGDAAVYNFTETQPTSGGFLTLYPGGTNAPNASDINFSAGMTRANMVMVPEASNAFDVLNVYDGQPTGNVQFILDIEGVFHTQSYGSSTQL